MRRFALLLIAFPLSSCDGPHTSDAGPHRGGRYQGIGTYPAGRLWAYQRPGQMRDPATATIDDDEQIVVTVDSQTGEVRQCGNLSGHCIVSNPWSNGNGPGVPLTAHTIDLDSQDEAATNEAQPVRR